MSKDLVEKVLFYVDPSKIDEVEEWLTDIYNDGYETCELDNRDYWESNAFEEGHSQGYDCGVSDTSEVLV